jgi:hypothetical protein
LLLVSNIPKKGKNSVLNFFVLAKPQTVTYVPPKYSKEEYLNSIFKILNVPEEERTISFEDPTKNSSAVPIDSIYNYTSLEECPSSLLRKFLLDRQQADQDPKYVKKRFLLYTCTNYTDSTLHHELVEKVRALKIQSKRVDLIF